MSNVTESEMASDMTIFVNSQNLIVFRCSFNELVKYINNKANYINKGNYVNTVLEIIEWMIN